jgi:ribosomal protein S15P/S13E
MRNTATRTTKTTVDKSGLNQLLTDARCKSAARALSLASRMVNLANHIKTNQLDINEALELLLQEAKFTAIRSCTNGRRNGFSTTARAKTANATSTTRAAVSLRLPFLCEECDAPIPEARRIAIPGVTLRDLSANRRA